LYYCFEEIDPSLLALQNDGGRGICPGLRLRLRARRCAQALPGTRLVYADYGYAATLHVEICALLAI
jgi:hypothetical protein